MGGGGSGHGGVEGGQGDGCDGDTKIERKEGERDYEGKTAVFIEVAVGVVFNVAVEVVAFMKIEGVGSEPARLISDKVILSAK